MNKANGQKTILFFHAGAEMYGADKILLELLGGLDKQKIRPVVVLPNSGPLVHEIEKLGIEIHVFELGVLRRKYFNPTGILNRGFHILLALARIYNLHRRHKFSCIHTNTSAVLTGGLAAKALGVPHVFHIHEITTTPRAMWKFLSFLIPRFSEKVVAVSHAVKEHLVAGNRLNREKAVVIYNGITTTPYDNGNGMSVREEYGISDSEALIGMVGRVNRWKGQHVFLDVAKALLPTSGDAKFLLVGGTFEGEEHLFSDLEKRIATDGLTGSVFISEFRDDIPDVMDALDIFVLPSIDPDPLPTVVLEAMCSGKPVVSFAHGGATEMVKDGETGMLVPVLDTKAMAAMIETLIKNREKRIEMGRKGKERCHRMFSKDAFIKNFEELYTNL